MIDRPGLSGRSRPPSFLGWILVPLLVLDVLVLLCFLALANATASGPAERTLGYSVAILTDVDTYLDEHYDALVLEAQEDNEAAIALPGFPLDINIAGHELTASDRSQFRALVLERSADKLQDEGAAAFRGDRNGEVNSGSIQGVVRLGIDMLRPTPHKIFFTLALVGATLAALLTLALGIITPPSRRITVIASSVFGGAALFLTGAVALRFALRVGADSTDDEMTREFLHLAQEADWAAIRNGIIMSTGAAITLAASLPLSRQPGKTEADALLQ